MRYSEDFRNLLEYAPDDYIGFGNPNANILFLCQETEIDGETATYPGIFEKDIINNAQNWLSLTQALDSPQQLVANCINAQKTTALDVCQKLVNAIFDRETKNTDSYDFHKFSFHTHLCNLTYKAIGSIYDRNYVECKQATLLRSKILSSDFFRNFNIVIAPLGHFPRHFYGNEYFGDILGVDFIGNEGQNMYAWMNVSERLDNKHPMLLIHSEHLQKSSVYDDSFIAQIAQRIIEFTKEKGFSLLPSNK